jgi:hypothetical protein
MGAIEELLKIISDLNLKRILGLIFAGALIAAGFFFFENSTRWFTLGRLERSQRLLNEIRAGDKIETTDPAILRLRAKILSELDRTLPVANQQLAASGDPKKPIAQSQLVPKPSEQRQFGSWFERADASVLALKFLAGALPWFLFSSIILLANRRKDQSDKSQSVAFWGMQIFTVFFGFVSVFVPSLSNAWMEFIVIPWGLFTAIAGVALGTAGASAYRATRDGYRSRAILNNFRMLSAAFNQVRLETGKTSVNLSDLVGPDKFIKSLTIIDGEDYSSVPLSSSATEWAVTTRHGLKVAYQL